jgi:hypothetical protein
MNKVWQFCAVYLTVSLPLAASCAREANTLEDEAKGGGAAGVSKAGSGFGKAGTTGAFGGTSGSAGKRHDWQRW